MRPRIAINCDLDEGPPERVRLNVNYIDYVVEAGGLPVILPPSAAAARELLAECDGLVLTGGNDYRLGLRGAPPAGFDPMPARREEADISLAREAARTDVPTLGICAGFQLQVLAGGGALYGDIATEFGRGVPHRRENSQSPVVEHPIQWPGALVLRDVTAGEHIVNSYHHQAVERLPPGWVELGRASDGLIEAAMAPRGFQVGVQWHPEREREKPLSRALIAELVSRARAHRAKRVAAAGATG